MNSYELDQPLDLRLKALNLSRTFTHYPPTIEESGGQAPNMPAIYPSGPPPTTRGNMAFGNYHHHHNHNHYHHQRTVPPPPPPPLLAYYTHPPPRPMPPAQLQNQSDPNQLQHKQQQQQPQPQQQQHQHSQQQQHMSRIQTHNKLQKTSDPSETSRSASVNTVAAPVTTASVACQHNLAPINPTQHSATFSSHLSRPVNYSLGAHRPGSATSWSSTSISSDASSSSSSSSDASSSPIVRQQSLNGRYNCKPCGIVFSQPETLKAHQEGYCTKTNRFNK